MWARARAAPQLSQKASPGQGSGTAHGAGGCPDPVLAARTHGWAAPFCARTGVPQASQKATPSGSSTSQFAQ